MYFPAFYDQKIEINRNPIIIKIQSYSESGRAKTNYKTGGRDHRLCPDNTDTSFFTGTICSEPGWGRKKDHLEAW